MAYEFTKLGEVEALEKVPKGANALIEIEGDIKRVPGDSLNGGIKTAIIKSSDYDDVLAGGTPADEDAVTFSCVNMTFEEALAEIKAGKPLSAMMFMVYINDFSNKPDIVHGGWSFFHYDLTYPNAIIIESLVCETLYWTSDGMSIGEPSAASTLSAKLSRAKSTTEG